MGRWRIRDGTLTDRGAVLNLWRAADSPPTATDTDAGLESLLRHDPDSLLLAIADAEVIGSTDLIRAGEDRLRELGAIRLTAIVAGGESGATELWRAAGYEQQSDRSRFVRMVD